MKTDCCLHCGKELKEKMAGELAYKFCHVDCETDHRESRPCPEVADWHDLLAYEDAIALAVRM